MATPPITRDELRRSIGHRIRYWREVAGLSRNEFADRCQVTLSAVIQWEEGRSGADQLRLWTIAGVLVGETPARMRIFWSRIPGDDQATVSEA